jgi:hypothetical protein
LTKEQKTAIQVAESMTDPASVVPRGKKNGRSNRKSRNRRPFKGHSDLHSEIARHVQALRFAGWTDREAFSDAAEKFDRSPVTVERLYYDKRELFELAEMEHVENALVEHQKAIISSRALMAKAGPKAVNTLEGIMDDPKASANVKKDAAMAILKLNNIDGSTSVTPNEKVAMESLKLIRDLAQSKEREEDSHIIDVTAVEEDESEVGTERELRHN